MSYVFSGYQAPNVSHNKKLCELPDNEFQNEGEINAMRDNDDERFYNLTHPQKRIWYVNKVNISSPLYNIGGCLSINGHIDTEIMKRTINIVLKKNDSLRMRIIEENGKPCQYIYKYEHEYIDFFDFSSYDNPKEKLKKWTDDIFKRNIKLENNKLYYFAIYKIKDDSYGIMLSIHHIISDGWSISLIESQICDIYSKLVCSVNIDCNISNSYLEFIEKENDYLSSKRFLKNKSFWNEMFERICEGSLYKTTDSIKAERVCFSFDDALSLKIQGFLKDKKCSLNTLFILLVYIYEYITTDKTDIVIGIPVSNRTDRNQKNTVGMFTSTVPLRLKLDTKLGATDLLKFIDKKMKYCLINQRYPYDLLMQDLNISKLGFDSLFKISINYYNFNFINDIAGMKAEAIEHYSGNQNYLLQITFNEWNDKNIVIKFDYKVCEYSKDNIKVMYDTLVNILKNILKNETIKINDISIFSEDEMNYKLYGLNQTMHDYPKKSVCTLFEEQVKKNPHKIALQYKDEKLTYEQLNKKSNQLANYLNKSGIKNESIVGIMMDNSIELIISILGVLKCGGAYLPIDTRYPLERIEYMLLDSESSMLIMNNALNSKIKFKGNITNFNNLNLDSYSDSNLELVNDLNTLVYIIYTSGSTGKPKGVMIEHKGLTNYVWWASKIYLCDEGESMGLYSSISFDLTVTTIFTPLISGNRIIIYKDDDETEFVIYKILQENKVTVLKVTPSHLRLIKDLDNSKSNIKRFIVGGEDLKCSLSKDVSHSFGGNIDIYNEYGPTEAVVGCMIHRYDEKTDKLISVPIGKPIDNVQIYLLDSQMKPVLDGQDGEIYISGDGVARGYLNREEMTLERFSDNPFIKGRKMYKTGDIGRYLKNGIIEYKGRIDNQVKIRGFRIELGEIEKYLLQNKSIKDVVASVDKSNINNSILNAYIVVDISKGEVTDFELRRSLSEFLPGYMIPNNFIRLNEIPLTVNGKVNYNQLKKHHAIRKNFVIYETEIEEAIVRTFEEVLGTTNISLNDNYYELGGDSIQAIQIASKLKEKKIDIRIKDVLETSSIGELCESCVNSQNITSNNIEDKKSFSKGAICNTPIIKWFFNQKLYNEEFYNQYVLIKYHKILNIDNVKKAINMLVLHHDELRINYNNKQRMLYYNDKYITKEYEIFKIDILSGDDVFKDSYIKKIMKKADIRFHIEDDPLFNVIVFNEDSKINKILFICHHLIVDGVSWRILINEFNYILHDLDMKIEIQLPEKTNSYQKWALALNDYSERSFDDEINYWNSLICRNFIYPEDFNMNKDIYFQKCTFDAESELSEYESCKLIKKGNDIYNIKLNEILLIALALTLKDILNKSDIIIETEGHGREEIAKNIDVSRSIGWFTSIYPVYLKVSDENIDFNIKSLKEQLRKIPHNGFDYGILKYLKQELDGCLRTNVRLNYLGNLDNVMDENIKKIKFGLCSDDNNIVSPLLDINTSIINKKIKIGISYSNAYFKPETAEKLINHYIDIIRLMLDEFNSKACREFTPSDFDTVEITQDELDSLFY